MGDKKSILTAEFLLGLFFLGALGLLLYFTAVVSGKDFLRRKTLYPLKVSFESIAELEENQTVYFRGLPVGEVSNFRLADDNESVLVTMHLDRKLKFYSEDYSIEIRLSSLFGGKVVHIDTGTRGDIVSEGEILEGTAHKDVLSEASRLVRSLREDEKLLRERFIESGFTEKLEETVANMNEISVKIKTGEGSIGKLLNDPDFYDNASDALGDIKTASEHLSKLASDLRQGKGSMGKLLTDDKAYEDLQAALKDIRELSASMRESEGTFGRLFADKGKLYDEMFSAVESLKQVSSRLADGRGTIGKLMQDEEFYNKAKAVVEQLQGAVEDYREQAPIATFGSMILGAL